MVTVVCDTVDALVATQDVAVPRYTSYPTAPNFSTEMADSVYSDLIASIRADEPISLYLHIPFCDRLCWFCGCNTKHTLKYAPVAEYVSHLLMEIAQARARIGFSPAVKHIHFGGGSPSFLKRDDFDRLAGALRTAFIVDDATEISVEIDPSDVTEDTLAGMLALGVTRASIGVQDFDADVQAAINRPQAFEKTHDVVDALRAHDISSVNIDALYGLPLQTCRTIERTMRQVLHLRPDRIALFGYAHVPWMKKHQKMIDETTLPDTLERFSQSRLAEKILLDGGYVKIGIDHFARRKDGLAVAQQQGTLKRNFQGYTTDNCKVLLGLGASSISSFEGGYVQNHVATGRYSQAVAAGEPTAAKAVRMNVDDRVRARMIEELMCRFRIDFGQLRKDFGSLAGPYIAEAQIVAAQDRDGFCFVTEDGLQLTETGKLFARIVASRFDGYFNAATQRHSKAI